MESLVSLTLRSQNSEFRIRKYIRLFKEKFSNILFQQLFTAKKYKEMMDLRSEFGFYLRSYLEQNNIAFLSWIIDLEQKQYQEASLKLINLSKTEPYLEKEDVLVSISKLADLQSKLLQTQNLETEMMNDDNFNSILDLIEFQRTIFDTFQQEINFGVLNYDQVHATVGQLMQRFYSKNLNRKVLSHLLRNTLTLLLEQKKVPLSHLLDLMIFRSSADEGPNVFKNVIETAVEHKEDLGDMFMHFLHRFWRQVLLSDHFQDLDLHKSGISDEMRSETLQRTNTFDVLLYLCITV